MDTANDLPVISAWTAASLSILFTLLYVLPFYLSPSTRPSPNLNRDASSVIRARIRTVSLACLISSLATLYLILHSATTAGNGYDYASAFHLLGYWPLPLQTSILGPLLLTCLLFLGPLFEKLLIQQSYLNLLSGPNSLPSVLTTPIGFRNYIAGPLTEEILFRSVLIPLHLLASLSPTHITFLTPLYFGIAHVHHFYEFRLTHPHTLALPALLRSLFQFGYTTLFGWYAAFVYLRTGSLVTVVLVHSFCNWCGLPRFWGRVTVEVEDEAAAGDPMGPPVAVGGEGRGKEDDHKEGHRNAYSMQANAGQGGNIRITWTVVYYLLLCTGAYGFYSMLWTLTKSKNALVDFGKR